MPPRPRCFYRTTVRLYIGIQPLTANQNSARRAETTRYDMTTQAGLAGHFSFSLFFLFVPDFYPVTPCHTFLLCLCCLESSSVCVSACRRSRSWGTCNFGSVSISVRGRDGVSSACFCCELLFFLFHATPQRAYIIPSPSGLGSRRLWASRSLLTFHFPPFQFAIAIHPYPRKFLPIYIDVSLLYPYVYILLDIPLAVHILFLAACCLEATTFVFFRFCRLGLRFFGGVDLGIECVVVIVENEYLDICWKGWSRGRMVDTKRYGDCLV
ncbi:hypothetical protein FPV67DRAFT_639970 [Lyophyllum atratum]|nr:hypothetical protein FPV67DRAFT_639970 [Lyophyllum atratum]